MMRFEAKRARAYYEESRPLFDMVHRKSRASLWALVEIYPRLLERIEREEFLVFTKRVSLPAVEKAWIVVSAIARKG